MDKFKQLSVASIFIYPRLYLPFILCHVEGHLISLVDLSLIIHISEGIRDKEKFLARKEEIIQRNIHLTLLVS